MSSETATAHALLIVDAETLLSRYPQPSQDPDKPTRIDKGLAFILDGAHFPAAKTDNHVLQVSLGQPLCLRTRTIALRAEHSIVVYSFTSSDTGVLPAPELTVKSDQPVPAIDTENLTQPILLQAPDHFWLFQPTGQGKEQCELSFMLVNTQCEAVGYFSWGIEVRTE
ncbi:hypothetical protein BFW87_30640 [Pseudomonas fluorescens]|uniref:Inclusion body protein n=1 Tax=Pseudomonas fluorescens TaxID=294 RepID=A0A1T2XUY2_PSEFL|nr:AidA/PixA family protein [Pseudomonas fluorescens]OPA83642.1 hypothetical protein BFW87_30640 [Pseudomonas fluorescens]